MDRDSVMSFWVILGLLLCTEAQESSGVTHVFVQKGDDVLLNVTTLDGLEEDFDGSWKFNKMANIVKFYPKRDPVFSRVYAERTEFSVKDFSVKLKNLQEADSGLYTLTATGINLVKTLAEYNITVQDPVPPVKLTVHPSVSLSSETCNLTVTCRTVRSQDSHINSTFRCVDQSCSQERGEASQVTTSGASLQVYLSNGSIICNHSNQVSWTKDIAEIELFCPRHTGSEALSAGFSLCLVKIVLFSAGLFIMVSAVITVHLMEKLKKHKQKRKGVPVKFLTASFPVEH